ncbi:MAG: glycosyltransferase family 9 protein [Candidatus Caenarcaniphilales bacterium]|nr:glycosyltransferase family 9 protein [Candidatus Caenarcaniphilales bacterium]
MKESVGQSLEIILPRDLVEAIHSLPALMLLSDLITRNQQLIASQNGARPNLPNTITKLRLYAPIKLFETINAVGLAETCILDEGVKVRSWFKPADHLVFLNDSILNSGMRGLKTYGLTESYDQPLPFLDLGKARKLNLLDDLKLWLRSDYGFSLSIIRYFGILEALGWSLDQMKAAFLFTPQDSLCLKNPITHWVPSVAKKSYLVIAPEGSQEWSWEHYEELIDRVYASMKLVTVLIGQQRKPKMISRSHLVDLREKLNFPQLSQLLHFASFVVSEDAIMLQLANLLHTPTLSPSGIYDLKLQGAIFPYWNTARKPTEVLKMLPSIMC